MVTFPIQREAPAAPESFVERLHALAPPGLGMQSLMLYWEPGYAWEPVERWMIARVWPRHMIPAYLRREYFTGPNPATEGYWDFKKDVWVPTGSGNFISRRQWQFYQEHESVMEPYWVIQGTGAGHRYRYSKPERVISQINGGPTEPPAPGDLPFAEPDMRAIKLLGARDRMRMHLNVLQIVEREGVKMTQEEALALEEMRGEVWDWLSAQAGEWADMAASQAARSLWDNAPRASNAAVRRQHEGLEALESHGIIT